MSDHISVMPLEAIEALQPEPGAWYIDATFGHGGHTQAILSRGGRVIALDVDQAAISRGQAQFRDDIQRNRLILIRENFAKLKDVVTQLAEKGQVTSPKGVLFDFGTNSEQLTSAERGFSFSGEGELDMRMDDRLGVKAKDLLMLLSEKQLTEVFSELGGEPEARKIAKEIVATRQRGEFEQLATVQGFSLLITRVKRQPRGHLHPATKVFQALRILVNDELVAIETALPAALEVLANSGRMVTLAFHEGEDRLVKHSFREWEQGGRGEVLTKHPMTPSALEIERNSRSRSAKLRIFIKNN